MEEGCADETGPEEQRMGSDLPRPAKEEMGTARLGIAEISCGVASNRRAPDCDGMV